MATWDWYAGSSRIITTKHADHQSYHCRVCKCRFERWRAAVDHDCNPPVLFRRYLRAFARSHRNNAKRRNFWYNRRMRAQAAELAQIEGPRVSQ